VDVSDCLFCKIVAGEIPSEKVHETDHILAFRDINPQAPTHVLVIPKEHVVAVGSMTAEQQALAGHLLVGVADVARALGLESFRTVANTGADAGQEVFHLHLHVLGGRSMAWPPG
jgi:histidine triad (HIT) family protein